MVVPVVDEEVDLAAVECPEGATNGEVDERSETDNRLTRSCP